MILHVKRRRVDGLPKHIREARFRWRLPEDRKHTKRTLRRAKRKYLPKIPARLYQRNLRLHDLYGSHLGCINGKIPNSNVNRHEEIYLFVNSKALKFVNFFREN